jgi:hypothetical protein
MRKKEYKQYLLSGIWLIRKREWLAINRDHRCFCCFSGMAREFHHISYRNVGQREEIKDLIYVCSNCHQEIHNLINVFAVPLSSAHLIIQQIYYDKRVNLRD